MEEMVAGETKFVFRYDGLLRFLLKCFSPVSPAISTNCSILHLVHMLRHIIYFVVLGGERD